MDKFIPAEAIPPGEFIKEEMDARGWTQEELAEVLGRTRQHVNRLIQGKTAITAESAHELAKAFGVSAELFLNLQSAYDLALADKDRRDIEKRQALFSKAPIADLRRRGWVPDTKDYGDIEQALCDLLRIQDISQEPSLSMAARMSADYNSPVNASQVAWLCRAFNLAHGAPAAPFKESSFEDGLKELRVLAANAEDARRIPKVLGDMGVRLVLVEHLPKT